MNLNRLLFDHQIAVMHAGTADVAEAEFGRISYQEQLLQNARETLGVAQYPVARQVPASLARAPATPLATEESNMNAIIEERTTNGRGLGIFALQSFRKGDILHVGVLDHAPIANHSHASQISKTEFVFHKGFSSKFNHSCDPNCGIILNETGGHNIVAMSDIAAEDEATYDYAMRNYRIEHFPGPCECGHVNCRGLISGWKDLPQQRKDDYAGFIAPYLIEIDREGVAVAETL